MDKSQFPEQAREKSGQGNALADGDQQAVAIFDLDGTITSCDTYLYFLIYSLLRQPLRWLKAPFLAVAVVMYFTGLRDNSWLKTVFLRSICKGWDKKVVAQRAEAFTRFIERSRIRRDAVAQIKFHRQARHKLVLASASPDLYVEHLAKRLGFDHVICTKVQWNRDDVLTGELDGDNCYGQHKLDRVDRFLQEQGPFAQIFAYTDHHSDLPLLQSATRAVAVSPTSKLVELAKKGGYDIETWA